MRREYATLGQVSVNAPLLLYSIPLHNVQVHLHLILPSFHMPDCIQSGDELLMSINLNLNRHVLCVHTSHI